MLRENTELYTYRKRKAFFCSNQTKVTGGKWFSEKKFKIRKFSKSVKNILIFEFCFEVTGPNCVNSEFLDKMKIVRTWNYPIRLKFHWKLQPTTAKQTKIQTNYNGHWSTCSGHYFGITPLNPFFFLQGHVTSYVCAYECTFVARLHTISKYSDIDRLLREGRSGQ